MKDKSRFLVITPDGLGRIINTRFRKNTNGGPGCREYVVRLNDDRIRRYNTQHVVFVMPKKDSK